MDNFVFCLCYNLLHCGYNIKKDIQSRGEERNKMKKDEFVKLCKFGHPIKVRNGEFRCMICQNVEKESEGKWSRYRNVPSMICKKCYEQKSKGMTPAKIRDSINRGERK